MLNRLATMAKIPNLKLYNGKEIPIFGLGTWKSEPGKVTQAVKDAIDIGYRHIDCAHVYGNEKEVGAALAAKFSEGVIRREDLFITSKLWNTYHRPDLVEPALRTTLKNLGLDYLDLYLIHNPTGYKEGEDLFPRDSNGKLLYSDVDYVDTWKAMEQLVEKNLVKSIGVSNFNISQLKRVLEIAKITIANNQVECHAYLDQSELQAFCSGMGITITAYSPLGSPDRPYAKTDDPNLLTDPKLQVIAKKYGKTVAQILLRYQIEKGNIVIPKSVTRSRLEENIKIFDFKLDAIDIVYIQSLNKNFRVCPREELRDHKYFPF